MNSIDLKPIKTWLEDLLKPGDLPTPFIYPANLGIECEWSFGDWEISLTYFIVDRMILMHAAQINSQEVREDRFSIEDAESVEKTRKFLQNFINHQHEIAAVCISRMRMGDSDIDGGMQ